MDHKEWKYQWSSKLENGEIILVRSDDKKELILDIEWAKSQVRQETHLESHPERTEEIIREKYEGKTLEEIEKDIDPSWCEIHEVKMRERMGKSGLFYSHSKGVYPDLIWCSGKGWAEK